MGLWIQLLLLVNVIGGGISTGPCRSGDPYIKFCEADWVAQLRIAGTYPASKLHPSTNVIFAKCVALYKAPIGWTTTSFPNYILTPSNFCGLKLQLNDTVILAGQTYQNKVFASISDQSYGWYPRVTLSDETIYDIINTDRFSINCDRPFYGKRANKFQ